jgi:DNA-directed RNA polymerase subunit M/transcription elongation factor TFIIS
MRSLEDLYEKCYCNKVLMVFKEKTIDSIVYECDECGYTYTILLEQLLGA